MGKRIEGLLHYVIDYKIIFISISYIILNILGINLLRNIDLHISAGHILLVIGVVITLFVVSSKLRNISANSNQTKKKKDTCRKLLHFLNLINLLVLMIVFSVIRLAPMIKQEKRNDVASASFTGQRTAFDAIVTSEITEKQAYNTIEVKPISDISISENTLKQGSQKFLIKIKKYENPKLGEVCNIKGLFKMPENFEDFNYKDYLKNNNIYLLMEFPEIECEEKRGGFFLQNILVDFKQKLNNIIAKNLKEPQSSLMMGIIFGQDRLFSEKFDNNVRMAGVSHIVAASGYNITILILAGSKLLKFLPLKLRLFLLLFLIWGFCILSGLSPSIVRACIMTSIALVAMILGKKNTIHITLPLAAFLFVLIDPKIVFNVGFQLSVVATLGLVYLQPALSNIWKKLFKKSSGFVEDTLLTTLSCTLTTLPITIYTFGTVSIWAVVANCLILPVIESTMFLGIFGLIFLKLFPLLSVLLFEASNVQLKYFELVVNLIGKAGWGYWELGKVGIIIPIVICVSLILLCIYFYPVEDESHNFYLKISS
jgi:competence protein ComEC